MYINGPGPLKAQFSFGWIYFLESLLCGIEDIGECETLGGAQKLKQSETGWLSITKCRCNVVIVQKKLWPFRAAVFNSDLTEV